MEATKANPRRDSRNTNLRQRSIGRGMQRALSRVLSMGTLAVAFSATASPETEIVELTIENRDPGGRTLWVKINGATQTKKGIAFCLPARDSRRIHVDLRLSDGRDRENFEIMGEITRNNDCQKPVDCTARQTVDPRKWMVGTESKPHYTFRSNAESCHFRAEPR